MNIRSSITSFFIVVTFLTISARAQERTPTPIPEEEGIVKVNSRLIVIPASVTDAAGNPVPGLKTDDFTVVEEGRRQTIDSIADADKVPLDIALLFDVSASTDAMFKFEQETAAKFLRDVMRPMDRAAIFTIGAEATMVQGFDSAERSISSVAAIRPTKEQTAFYDSLRSAVSYVRSNSGEGRRRVFLTISDGEDTNSDGVLKAIWAAERKIADNVKGQALREIRVKARDSAKAAEQSKVLKALQDADAVFYSINPAGSSYQLNQMSVFGQENMQRFATETGGTAYLPKFQPIDTKDELQNRSNLRRNTATLDGIFKKLMNELQAQYLVQYYSDSEYPAGRYVKLKVGLQNSANRRLRAREGYFVKN